MRCPSIALQAVRKSSLATHQKFCLCLIELLYVRAKVLGVCVNQNSIWMDWCLSIACSVELVLDSKEIETIILV